MNNEFLNLYFFVFEFVLYINIFNPEMALFTPWAASEISHFTKKIFFTKIGIPGFFRSLITIQSSKFKIPDDGSNMADRKSKHLFESGKIEYSRVFWVAEYDSGLKIKKSQNDRSNMANRKSKNLFESVKLGTRRFLRSLISILFSKFKNSQ